MKRITAIVLSMLFLTTNVWADIDAKSLCRETALKYAHYADTGQRDKFSALFTKEGSLVSPSGTSKPAQEESESQRPTRTTRHVATNHLVQDEDGQLTGTSYFTFYFSPDAQEEALPITGQPTAVGVYHDKYTIENGQCKFTERVAKVTFAGE
ncbi:MAG: hypothetical protein ACI9ON_001794 [Limisphaerales bacterium]|jgi:hypothetical protein